MEMLKSVSEKGARLCRRPAAAGGKRLNAPSIRDRLRLVEADTAALRDFQTRSYDIDYADGAPTCTCGVFQRRLKFSRHKPQFETACCLPSALPAMAKARADFTNENGHPDGVPANAQDKVLDTDRSMFLRANFSNMPRAGG